MHANKFKMDDIAAMRARYGWREPLKAIETSIQGATLANNSVQYEGKKLGTSLRKKTKPIEPTERTKVVKHRKEPKHLRNICKEGIFCIKPHLQNIDDERNIDNLVNFIKELMTVYMSLCNGYEKDNEVNDVETPAQNCVDVNSTKGFCPKDINYDEHENKCLKPKLRSNDNIDCESISEVSGKLTKNEEIGSEIVTDQLINLYKKYSSKEAFVLNGTVTPKVTLCRDIRIDKSSTKDLREQIIRLSVINDRGAPSLVRESHSDTCITLTYSPKLTQNWQLSKKSNVLQPHSPKKSVNVCFCEFSTNLDSSDEEIGENQKNSLKCVNELASTDQTVKIHKDDGLCCGDALIQNSTTQRRSEETMIDSSLHHIQSDKKTKPGEKEDTHEDEIHECKSSNALKSIEIVPKNNAVSRKNCQPLLPKIRRKNRSQKEHHNGVEIKDIFLEYLENNQCANGDQVTKYLKLATMSSFLNSITRSKAISQLIEENANKLQTTCHLKSSIQQFLDKLRQTLPQSYCFICFYNKCIYERSLNVLGEKPQHLSYGGHNSSVEIENNNRPPNLASCIDFKSGCPDNNYKFRNHYYSRDDVMTKGKFWKGGTLFERRCNFYDQKGKTVITITPSDWCGLMYQQINSNSRLLRLESSDLTLTKKHTYKKKNSTYKHIVHTHAYRRFKTKPELYINLIKNKLELDHHPQLTAMACDGKNNQDVEEESTPQDFGLLYEEDDDYCETYMDQLTENDETKHGNNRLAKGDELTPSLPEIIVDTDMCDCRMEIPWLKITLPPPGYYEIQKMEGRPRTICDCWNIDKRDSVLSAKAYEPVGEVKCTCDVDSETNIAPEVGTSEKTPAEDNPQEEAESKPESETTPQSNAGDKSDTESTPESLVPLQSDAPPKSDMPPEVNVPNEETPKPVTSHIKSSLKSSIRSESGSTYESGAQLKLGAKSETKDDIEKADEIAMQKQSESETKSENASKPEFETSSAPEANATLEAYKTTPESVAAPENRQRSNILADSYIKHESKLDPEFKTMAAKEIDDDAKSANVSNAQSEVQPESGEPALPSDEPVDMVPTDQNNAPIEVSVPAAEEHVERKKCTCQEQIAGCPILDEFFIPSPTKFVYDWPCDSTNEGYMDPIYRMYPDDCDKKCGPQTEIPWNDIVLPKNIRLRTTRKPTPAAQNKTLQIKSDEAAADDCNQQKPDVDVEKQADSSFEIQLSFTEISGNIVDVKCEPPLQQVDSNTQCQKDYVIRVHASTCGDQRKLQSKGLKTTCAPCNALEQKKVGSEVIVTIRKPQNDKQRANETYETTNLEECNCEAITDNGLMGAMYKKTLSIDTPDRQTQIVTEGAYMSVNCQCDQNCDAEQCTKTTNESQARKTTPTSRNESQICMCKDPVINALETYQAEMEPLRDTLNQIRAKIRSLNIPELNNWNASSRKQNLRSTGNGCSYRSTARTITKMRPPTPAPFGPPPPSPYGIGSFPPNQFGYPPPGVGPIGGIPLGMFGPPTRSSYPPYPKFSPPDKRTKHSGEYESSKNKKKKKKSKNRSPSTSDLSDYDSDGCPFMSALRQLSTRSVCEDDRGNQRKSRRSSSNANLKESKRKRGKRRSQEALREERSKALKADAGKNQPKYQDNETDTEPEIQIHYGPKSPRVITKQVFRGFIDESMATAKTQRLRIAVRVTPSGEKMMANDDLAIEDVDECDDSCQN